MQERLVSLYDSLVSLNSVASLNVGQALDHIGQLIDVSCDLGRVEGLHHAITLSQELDAQQLTTTQIPAYHYFVSNAWAALGTFNRSSKNDTWSWVQEESEKQIFHLRHSWRSEGFADLMNEPKCQVLTNLGNVFDHVGRFVEAIEYWDEALSLVPSFGMALGNRGIAFTHYARALYDSGHRSYFLHESFKSIEKALPLRLDEGAKAIFEKYKHWLESVLPLGMVGKELQLTEFSLGSSPEEISYRKWCLNKRLFLNPLNDLGPHPIAARDIFGLPSIISGVGEGPYYYGCYNQLKQEFASARYLLFSSTQSETPHFSDRGVHLYNTLDYPSYAFSAERGKAAFRIVYSLFDKIAFFLNHYLNPLLSKIAEPGWKLT